MLRVLVSWILIALGVAVGLYGAIQLLLGVVAAVRGPELAAGVGVAAGGALTFVAGALIAGGGRRLRRRGRR